MAWDEHHFIAEFFFFINEVNIIKSLKGIYVFTNIAST